MSKKHKSWLKFLKITGEVSLAVLIKNPFKAGKELSGTINLVRDTELAKRYVKLADNSNM
jgi:hypothetical protein